MGKWTTALLVLAAVLTPSSPRTARGENLIRNSSFKVATNPGLPDYWSPGKLQELRDDYPECWRAEPGGPLPGVCSMRMSNPSEQHTVVAMCLRHVDLRLTPATDYTLSFYTKTSGEKMKALVTASGACGSPLAKTVALQGPWARHVFSFRTPDKMPNPWVHIGLNTASRGTLWFAAPQLEIGKKASPYRPAASDRAGQPGTKQRKRGPLPAPPETAVTVTEKGIEVDGKLDDEAWKEAVRLTRFHDAATGEPPPVATEALLVRDSRHLFIALRCAETDMTALRAQADPKSYDSPLVFGDDSVEVFIASDPDGKGYLQLAVTAAGARFDALPRDYDCNVSWRAATSRGPKAWTVEIALPMKIFQFPADPSKPWRINLCRNRPRPGAGAEGFSASWSPVPNSFHTPWRFGYMRGMAGDDLATYSLRCEPAGTKLSGAKPRGRPAVRITALPWGKGPRKAKMNFVLYTGKPFGTTLDSIDVGPLAPGQTVTVTNAPIIEAGDPCVLLWRLTDAATGQVVNERTWINPLKTLAALPKPIKAMFERTLFNTDEPTVAAIVEVRLSDDPSLKGARIRLSLTGPDPAKPVAEETVAVGPRFNWRPKVPPDLKGLVLIRAELRDAAGKPLQATDDQAWRARRTPNQTYVDKIRRMWVVDGRPTYLYNLFVDDWTRKLRKTKASQLVPYRDWAEHHFGSITYAGIDRAAAFILDAARQHGLRVVAYVHPSGPYKEARKKILDLVGRIKDHPALVGYMYVDEPAPHVATEAQLADLFYAIKTEDPNHVAFNAHCGVWVPGSARYGGLAITEVYQMNKYPFRTSGVNVDGVRTMVRLAEEIDVDSRRDGKVNALAMQIYASDYCGRTPTIGEMNAQLYGSLVRGTRMAMVFVYKSPYPALWEHQRALADEMRALSPVLGGTEDPKAVRARPPCILHTVFRYEGKRYLVTVNVSDMATRAQFGLREPAKGKQAKVWFENRTVGVKSGGFSDRFEPLERHVYEIP